MDAHRVRIQAKIKGLYWSLPWPLPPPFFLTRSGNLEMFLGVSSLFKAWLEQGTRALPSSGSRHMSRLFE
jgi:hypothetical protein